MGEQMYLNMREERVVRLKHKNKERYDKVSMLFFGKPMSIEEVSVMPEEKRIKFYSLVELSFILEESNSDFRNYAKVLQVATCTGVGEAKRTRYTCSMCKKAYSWESTNTPVLCESCSESVAKRTVLLGNLFTTK